MLSWLTRNTLDRKEKIMADWIERKISDIGTVVGGATPLTKNPENYENGKIAWITPKDLSTFTGRYIERGERNITGVGLRSCSTQLLPKNTVLFSSRAPIGYVAIAANEVCTNQGFKSVIPNEKTDPLFLFYLLKYNKDKIEGMGSGTTFKEVFGTTMKNIVVNVPTDKGVQEKIAAILGSIDDKIEENKQINKNLLEQALAIYKDWFCDYALSDGILPENWKITTIDAISSMVTRGIAPKYDDNSDQIVLNQKCIRDHTIDISLSRRHRPKKINEKWISKGDLLINSTGTGTLGRVAQVWFEANNMTVDSHVTIVRPKDPILQSYIGFWGLSHESEIEAQHTGSTGQTELPRDRVKAMELPLPDEDTLSKFNELVIPMTSLVISNQEENDRLSQLRDALLPKLMSGEIDVSALSL
jgi:hypothetical protein